MAIRDNREVTLGELVGLHTDEVQETRTLLTADEERLFSEFLTGQVRTEVVAKVRDATALVGEINRNLKRVRTAGTGRRASPRAIPVPQMDGLPAAPPRPAGRRLPLFALSRLLN